MNDIEPSGIERENPQRKISYKEFKKLPVEEIIGTRVEDIHPYDLFVTQDWLDQEKYQRAVSGDMTPAEQFVAKGYFAYKPIPKTDKLQRIIVLGDGHHGVLREWNAGRKVTVQIVGVLPSANYQGMSVYRQKVGDPFR